MRIAELMKPELAAEAVATRKLLALVPDDKLGWSPGAGIRPIDWNAAHLVEIVGWLPGILGQAEWDLAPVGGEPYATPEATSIADLLNTFDANLAAALAALDGVPDEVMAEPWSLKAGGHVLLTMPKGPCLRKWVFSHTAHHRGILSSHLRLAGVPHGSIYESEWMA